MHFICSQGLTPEPQRIFLDYQDYSSSLFQNVKIDELFRLKMWTLYNVTCQAKNQSSQNQKVKVTRKCRASHCSNWRNEGGHKCSRVPNHEEEASEESHHDATNNWVCIIAAEHTCLSLLGKNEGSSIQALWVNWILLVLDRAQRKLYMSCSNPSRVVSYWISKAHVLKSDASKIEEGIRFFSHAPKQYSKLWCYTHKSLPTIKLTDALLKGHDRRVGLFAKI